MADDLIILQQEPIPPASEIDCIETNKVFDECLLRDCFTAPATIGVTVDPHCISDIKCEGFRITVAGPIIPTRRVTDEPGFVRVSFPFTIDYTLSISSIGSCGVINVPGTTISRTVSNVLLYCPEPIAYILTQQGTASAPTHLENETIKLEFVGECVDVVYAPNPNHPEITDITPVIGYYLIIKCEQVVQLQVLSTGYCTAPFCSSPIVDPCFEFNERPIPEFFPASRTPL